MRFGRRPSGRIVEFVARELGLTWTPRLQHFQPRDRFWTFQAIESAILVGLALALDRVCDLLGHAPGELIQQVSENQSVKSTTRSFAC